jgi:hypothetical protein
MRILALISAVVMPIFNIPLIWRVMRRKSADDISAIWVIGVWVCTMGLTPTYLRSPDRILNIFGIINGICFTGVFVAVLYYHPIFRRKS